MYTKFKKTKESSFFTARNSHDPCPGRLRGTFHDKKLIFATWQPLDFCFYFLVASFPLNSTAAPPVGQSTRISFYGAVCCGSFFYETILPSFSKLCLGGWILFRRRESSLSRLWYHGLPGISLLLKFSAQIGGLRNFLTSPLRVPTMKFHSCPPFLSSLINFIFFSRWIVDLVKDKIRLVNCIGGFYRAGPEEVRPTRFLCSLAKLVELHLDNEIFLKFLTNTEFKWVYFYNHILLITRKSPLIFFQMCRQIFIFISGPFDWFLIRV